MTDTPGNGATEDSAPGALGAAAAVLRALTEVASDEMALARAQLRQSLRQAVAAGVALVLALVLGLAAVNLLTASAVAGLMRAGFGPVWATLTVGLVLTLLAAGSAAYAWTSLRSASEGPGNTLRSLRRNAETLRSMVIPGATDTPTA